jgi:hypothetical protein
LWLGLAAGVGVLVLGALFLLVNREVIFARGEQRV